MEIIDVIAGNTPPPTRNLRQLRESMPHAGSSPVSANSVARGSGVGQADLSRYESGLRLLPTRAALKLVAYFSAIAGRVVSLGEVMQAAHKSFVEGAQRRKNADRRAKARARRRAAAAQEGADR